MVRNNDDILVRTQHAQPLNAKMHQYTKIDTEYVTLRETGYQYPSPFFHFLTQQTTHTRNAEGLSTLYNKNKVIHNQQFSTVGLGVAKDVGMTGLFVEGLETAHVFSVV